MAGIQSVFIVEPDHQGWIIERLMRELATELAARGIATRIGPGAGYQGEEVIFNSRFLIAMNDARARVNSLFITHVDDKYKELDLRSAFSNYNSFVCLSPQDADYVVALKRSREGVVGIELPARDMRVRPIRLVMFSARYEDGRKNEQWIVDYFADKTAEQRGAFVFSFLGWGWESFCASLGKLEMNYEIYRYSRFLPGEYELYKEIIPRADALIYLGFDGGAMSVYDALSAGVEVIASDTSYHRGLGKGVSLFANREGFFGILDGLQAARTARLDALRGRSIASYTDRLLAHWNAVAGGPPDAVNVEPPAPGAREMETLADYRAHYKPLGLSRLRSSLIRWIQTRMIRF
jgi:hypothetical protein